MGILQKSQLWERRRLQIMASLQDFRYEFSPRLSTTPIQRVVERSGASLGRATHRYSVTYHSANSSWPNKYQIRNAETHGLSQHARQRRASGDIVVKISRDRTGWLATQCRWSPAPPIFPANREFYREFCKIAASEAPETINNGVVTWLPMRIPYSTEQGV